MKALLFLALFFTLSFCQIQLLSPHGRGFSEFYSHYAPCGQGSTEVGSSIQFEHATVHQIQVQVIGAGGGGVIFDRWSCVLNGDDENNLGPVFPIEGAMKVSVPDADFQIYNLFVQAPGYRCIGQATMQLVYATNNGQEYYQCQDVIITNTVNGSSMLAANLVFVLLAIFGVLLL